MSTRHNSRIRDWRNARREMSNHAYCPSSDRTPSKRHTSIYDEPLMLRWLNLPKSMAVAHPPEEIRSPSLKMAQGHARRFYKRSHARLSNRAHTKSTRRSRIMAIARVMRPFHCKRDLWHLASSKMSPSLQDLDPLP